MSTEQTADRIEITGNIIVHHPVTVHATTKAFQVMCA